MKFPEYCLSKITLLIACIVSVQSFAQIIAGPMLGALEMKEAKIWVQTDRSVEIRLSWTSEGLPSRSQSLQTSKSNAFTALFTLDSLNPNTVYKYKLYVNSASDQSKEYSFTTPDDWAFRRDPPVFQVALGSCTYINEVQADRPGKPYGQAPTIFERIADRQPELMIWLGDNTYLRPVDFGSRSGVLHRYTDSRKVPELQRLLSTCSHHAIWDDHDFGPNDAVGSYPYRAWSSEAFRLFWANSVYGAYQPGDQTGYFNRNGIDFILLDNRTYRTSSDLSSGKAMLGKGQIDWLIDNLKYSRAPFKVVACGSQVLNSLEKYENMAVYLEERAYLLKRIEQEQIKGVVFVTGDRHHTELSKLTLEGGIVVHDLTCSPLTSSTKGKDYDEENLNRVEGTLVNVNNFGLLKFSGTFKKRILEIEIIDAEGNSVWNKIVEP